MSFLLSLLIGCTDYDIIKQGDIIGNPNDGAVPNIVVSPTWVDFGTNDAAAGIVKLEIITIENEGDASLQIYDLSFSDAADEDAFDISSIGSVLVSPGGSTTFVVSYEAHTAESRTAEVLIESNDPDEPVVAVDLTAEGVAPVIEIAPETYDFGSVYIGCDSSLPVAIRNTGNADLVVSEIEYVTVGSDLGLDRNLDTNGSLPLTVPAGAEVEVFVDYTPLDDFPDNGYISVTSNDPQRPTVRSSQSAAGSRWGEKLDVFEQPIKGLTDIIFTVDWSCSMADDIARVQANFDVFIGTLTAMDADYHVAVVTDDDGCVNGSQPYIDNTMSTSDQEALFDTMLNDYSYGAYTEMGFTLLEAATTSTALRGCNEDMLRDDATLALVGVTDEVEQSANTWRYYVSLFQGLKADPDDVFIHAIAGDYPTGCGGNEPGLGWYEASIATGGLFLSICATDWASHLEALAEGSTADLSRFALTQTPVVETIEVSIDGIVHTSGWTYDASTNSVVFDEDWIPEGGSTIEVEYAIPGDCEI